MDTHKIAYELVRLHSVAERDGEPIDSFISVVFTQAEERDLHTLKVSPKKLLIQCQLITGTANRWLAAKLQTDPTLTVNQVVHRLRVGASAASQEAVIARIITSNGTTSPAVQGSQVETVLRQRTAGTTQKIPKK
ncbi:hypothetical protein M514_05175 [Trichuris suis]|uniref:Uncharacterized protein n=1 Tax=Trichuris suis TaxID=68888 RepID=A0A085MZX8_9BILA|nr:hypothetical protein M513_05175 [Trichuris suis]KFD62774.1 hypothetical protein M514_05175 [Trichuris suis]